ncbi:MAG: SIS domain-containing protein [Candidatus Nanoarchaeia archaeon]|nr:SIS domain-containing protein [Candidatus Haiyanarchaeum thermophilum]MCW1303177.1 SIS domain-containing protein [Candidatus Haiyanarchaeum thermophilum]MCW1303843.1 SIS domain-containing protein [Candidatus Haiyanarchaeum thermophilum]MCW1306541.1 SIS domain-containing protein [Candidatus Haiyanarchaeum thermophilum]MCW1306955.1 SIS domain-containing protein [Candidatus Haiyanarchaeum thermophilum]
MVNWEELEEIHDTLNTKKYLLAQGEDLELTLQKNRDTVTDVARTLNFVEKIVICGAGDKYAIPLIAQYLWRSFSRKPMIVIHSKILAEYPNFLDDRTCVFLLSQSGRTKDTLLAMKMAMDRGAVCIGITNMREVERGTLFDVSTYPNGILVRTYTKYYPEKPLPATGTFHTTLFILNLILLSAIQEEGFYDVSSYIKFQTEQLPKLTHRLSTSVELIDWSREMALKLSNFKQESFYILGDGPRYGIARKAMINFMEGSKQDCMALETEEFHHNLIATLDRVNLTKKFLILIKPKEGFVSEHMSKLLMEIYTYWMKFGEEEKYLEIDPFKFVDVVVESTLGNLLTPPLYAIPIQWITYYLALLKGTDPGFSEVVGKVRG